MYLVEYLQTIPATVGANAGRAALMMFCIQASTSDAIHAEALPCSLMGFGNPSRAYTRERHRPVISITVFNLRNFSVISFFFLG